MSAKKPDAKKLKFTDEQIRKASKRPSLPDGVHCFMTGNPTIGVIEKGNYAGCLTLNLDIFAMKKPGDPTTAVKPGARDSCFLPMDNPEWPSHEAPDWSWGMSANLLLAVLGEGAKVKGLNGKPIRLLRSPKWKNGTCYFDGKKIKSNEEQKCARVANKNLGEICIALYADPSPLKNKMYYGKLGYRDKDTEKRFKNVLERWPELPEGASLADLNVEGVIGATPNRKPTAGASKKKISRRRK